MKINSSGRALGSVSRQEAVLVVCLGARPFLRSNPIRIAATPEKTGFTGAVFSTPALPLICVMTPKARVSRE